MRRWAITATMVGLFGLLCWSASSRGRAAGLSAHEPGFSNLFLFCAADLLGLSKGRRFYRPITDEKARQLAGAELGWLDTHPFPLSGATAGQEVKVLVRLKAEAVAGTAGFRISPLTDAFRVASGSQIDAPIWVKSPHDSWADGYIPDRAVRQNQTGEVTVHCIATDGGNVASCWVMRETPPDFDFGEAVLLLMRSSRMQPVDAAGAPVVGRPFVQTFKYEGFKDKAFRGPIEPHWAR